jgi:hypothetical protein
MAAELDGPRLAPLLYAFLPFAPYEHTKKVCYYHSSINYLIADRAEAIICQSGSRCGENFDCPAETL